MVKVKDVIFFFLSNSLIEELDSYMYQSVGHDVIEAYSECMQLPLYRHPISRKPTNIEYEYVPTADDEVEDLFELIKQVKEKHPELEAVSSGAIFSNYQKNRVENICDRLGLVSLAYLWQREQKALLDEMIASSLHAILIKVAVYGLDGNDLGKSLAEMRPKLFDLEAKVGINVCGEGGEFESMTLDCPLFKKRLMVDSSEKIVHRDHYQAPVVYLKIHKWHTEIK
jgi:diphthine-ammonia ligase